MTTKKTKSRTYQELPKSEQFIADLLVEDICHFRRLSGEEHVGYNENDVSRILNLRTSSIAALKAHWSRRNPRVPGCC